MIVTAMIMLLSMNANDVHSYGNTHEVKTKHLSLDLTIDFDKKTITGFCDITLNYVRYDAAYIDLDTRDLKVTQVANGQGKRLKFELGESQGFMGRRLRIFLKDHPSVVRVYYQTDPGAGALQWLNREQTTSKKYPFLFTQGQSILTRTWIPCMDSPGIRVTYDATIRVPKGMNAIMSANHSKHMVSNGIFNFKMPHPIPPYLLALAVGEISFRKLSDRTGVYAEPAVIDKAAWEFVDMEKMIVAAEALYGDYRWGRWDTIVLPPSFPFGGMENPMLTFATPTLLAGDRSLVSVMAHELAHSWSGNLVTNSTWSDFWLNEGFTTYFERRIMESLYGKEIVEMHWLLGQRDLQQTVANFKTEEPEFNKLYPKLDGRDPDDAFSDIPYEKGANFLRVLEHEFGRKAFDKYLRSYFDSNAFSTMTTEDFLNDLNQRLFAGDLSKWKKLKIKEWIYGGGLPDNMIIPKSDRFEKTRGAAKAFAESGSLDGIDKSWVTAEWLDFLNSLPEELDKKQLTALDKAYGFTKAGNSEILFAWQMIAIRNNYKAAYPALEAFLVGMGRRKFLQPLYKAMWANKKTRKMAKKVYKKARSGYHPLAVATIDGIVKL